MSLFSLIADLVALTALGAPGDLTRVSCYAAIGRVNAKQRGFAKDDKRRKHIKELSP